MVATLKTLKRKYVRVSSAATITHLKKFIAKKVLDGMEKYKDVSIVASQNLLFLIFCFKNLAPTKFT